nr:MAG TPA: hypothetical protein [Caudoviricetes sp.]
MQEKINLTLPNGWNQCTPSQLEQIAAIMQEQIEKVDRYHPFDMQKVKIAVFFLFAGVQIDTYPDPRLPINEQCYYVSMRLKKKRSRIPFAPVPSSSIAGSKGTAFPLYLWQLNYWLSPKAKTNDKTSIEYIAQGAGLLDWLDADSGNFLTRFPYPLIKQKTKWYRRSKTFQGPHQDLDGFSWQQYRFASDMMQTYTRLHNNLIKMKKMDKFTEEQLQTQAESVASARNMFLATIFNTTTQYIDPTTGITKYDFHYESKQFIENAGYFVKYPEANWQVILFWWSGIMHTLAHRYPHVFKVQKVDNKKPQTPMEIYTATTATMQKYAGLTEDQVNTQSYSLVLEHLERLSKENEEMEKMRRNK